MIPPGTPHSWGNANAEPSHTVVRLTPALHIEEFFGIFCVLATDGKAASSGLPRNPLRLAVLLSPLLTALAALGRLFRLRSGYPHVAAD